MKTPVIHTCPFSQNQKELNQTPKKPDYKEEWQVKDTSNTVARIWKNEQAINILAQAAGLFRQAATDR